MKEEVEIPRNLYIGIAIAVTLVTALAVAIWLGWLPAVSIRSDARGFALIGVIILFADLCVLWKSRKRTT